MSRKVHTASGKTFDETQAQQERMRDSPEGQALREADTLYEKKKAEGKKR